MKLDDVKISKAIIDRYHSKLTDALDVEVALVGGGPSNLVCGMLLGEAGVKTVLFETKLAPGGGMWGGGMMFNEIVIQESALHLMKKLGIRTEFYEEGYYTADSVESCGTLISKCVQSGTRIFNLVKVEDVMFRRENGEKRINGLVLQWSPVNRLGLHVDPLTVRASYVVEGTGHPAEVCEIITRKMDAKLRSRTGKVVGEMSMWADEGELLTIDNSCEVFPGLFVTGMAANATMGAPRMGPVFGGMLLSGEKVANTLIGLLRPERKSSQSAITAQSK
ncbi:MAG: thiazole biosynthesis protein [candidate division Zixibacteria bacterium]|nr:thiazole biosynthesis protein [candidate division Zixibacteria bacterium]